MSRPFGTLVAHKGPKKPQAAPREAYLQDTYGIGQADWYALKETQGGLCAICRKPHRLYVDHDHKTGWVRGLLCGACNYSLGVWRDDAPRFARAFSYLTRSKRRAEGL